MIKEVVKDKMWRCDGTGSKVMETELIFIKTIGKLDTILSYNKKSQKPSPWSK
jgi:hypothetical protein